MEGDGYGIIRNTTISLLMGFLNEDDKKEYIKKLKKEDPVAYKEYVEWVSSL